MSPALATWLALAATTLALFFALRLGLRPRRDGWEALAAALMVGLAGYAMQGHPGLPAAPKPLDTSVPANAADLVQDRHRFSGMVISPNKWVVTADALASGGQYGEAANFLRSATAQNPKDSDAWLAQANALVSHAQGTLTPAALYAFNQAAAADPDAPGPAMFLGLAMARGGRFDETRAMWQDLLNRAPADAQWRPDLQERLRRLDRILAMLRQAQFSAENPPSDQAPPQTMPPNMPPLPAPPRGPMAPLAPAD